MQHMGILIQTLKLTDQPTADLPIWQWWRRQYHTSCQKEEPIISFTMVAIQLSTILWMKLLLKCVIVRSAVKGHQAKLSILWLSLNSRRPLIYSRINPVEVSMRRSSIQPCWNGSTIWLPGLMMCATSRLLIHMGIQSFPLLLPPR